MRGLTLWTLICSLTVAASAVANSAPSLAVTRNEIRQQGFIYCTSGLISTFNPQMVSSGLTVNILAPPLYDTLLDVDPYTYRLKPALAESWEVLDNGATYRLNLRKNVAFQQTEWFKPSRTMNADDVLFSFNRIIDSNHPYHDINGGDYPYFDSLQFGQNIQSLRKYGNYSIEFRLKKPDASFLWHMASYYAPILSAEYAEQLSRAGKEQLMDRQPVGTGPFQLEEFRADQYVRLQRNPYFWKGIPRMRQVVIDLTGAGTGRLSKLISGECDVLAYPPASQLNILRNEDNLRLTVRPGMNMAYLAFNTRKTPLDNPEVRHALTLAINNQRLMQSIYYGTAETAASILPRASWAYDNASLVTEYNPAKSRQILKQLGLENLHLRLLVPSTSQSYNPSPVKTAELIQADLAQAGVKVSIIQVEGRSQETRIMNTNYDLTLTGWATDSNDPDSFLRPQLSCAASRSQTNYALWCNKEFDTLLQQALESQELSKRIDYYHQAQELLARELPVLPLASSLRLEAYRSDIKGLVLSPFGSTSFAGVYRESPAETKSPSAPVQTPSTTHDKVTP